jgi:prolyl oligopeptidase
MTARPGRYPAARRESRVEVLHGRAVADPYRWLEDAESVTTRSWMQAQQACADAELNGLPARDTLRDLLIRALSAPDRAGLPRWAAGRAFFLSARRPGADHLALLVRDQDGRTAVVVDPAVLDPSGRSSLDAFAPSPDGRMVACQISRDGTEDGTLTVIEAGTGRVILGPVGGVRHSPVAWLGTRGIYYVAYDAGIASVRWRDLRSQHDAVVHRATGTTTRFGLALWHGRWLALSVRHGAVAPAGHRLADLAGADPGCPPFRDVNLGPGATALTVGREHRLYARTTDGAPNGRLIATPDLTAEDVRVVLAERADAVLTGTAVFDHETPPRVLAAYIRDGRSELQVHHALSGQLLHRVALPGDGMVTALSAPADGDPCCWLHYSAPLVPPQVLRLDIRSGTVTREPGHAPGTTALDATVLRVSYPSADGTEIPMTLLIPGGHSTPERPRPTVLTGYGGFGYTTGSRFHPEAAAWVAAGGIWATAGLRGGGERGKTWHEAGRGANKPNAIADLHAAGDWLIQHGWTARAGLALLGASNAGLLAGAALAERPHAYAAVACIAPILDMVRYEQSGLGAQWRHEYGSAAIPEQLDWLLSYSPYHQVQAGRRYPPTLLVTLGGDTRVDAMHARKMCAALQHADTGGGPVILHRVNGVGHGSKPLSQGTELAAIILGFLAHHTGLTPA